MFEFDVVQNGLGNLKPINGFVEPLGVSLKSVDFEG